MNRLLKLVLLLTIFANSAIYAENIVSPTNLKNKTVDFHAHPVTQEFREGINYLGIDVIKEVFKGLNVYRLKLNSMVAVITFKRD